MITMSFPNNMSRFVDPHGNVVVPDASGQCSIEDADYPVFMAAGFMPTGLVSAEVAQEDLAAIMAKAMAGDLVFVVTPATHDRAATAAAWQRTVTVELQTAAGEVHSWFNKAIATGVSIADDSTAGTASIPSTTLTFVDGVATVVVSGDAAAWLEGETNTLTVAQATIMGYTVAAKTSVETIIAA